MLVWISFKSFLLTACISWNSLPCGHRGGLLLICEAGLAVGESRQYARLLACLPARASNAVPAAESRSLRQRVWPQLEMHSHGLHALAAFDLPRRAITARCPQPAALPAAIRVIDASVEPLGEEAHRIGHAQRDHVAVLV